MFRWVGHSLKKSLAEKENVAARSLGERQALRFVRSPSHCLTNCFYRQATQAMENADILIYIRTFCAVQIKQSFLVALSVYANLNVWILRTVFFFSNWFVIATENMYSKSGFLFNLSRLYVLKTCFFVFIKRQMGEMRSNKFINNWYWAVLFNLIINLLCCRSICWISQTLLSRAVSCSFLSRPAWRFVLI